MVDLIIIKSPFGVKLYCLHVFLLLSRLRSYQEVTILHQGAFHACDLLQKVVAVREYWGNIELSWWLKEYWGNIDQVLPSDPFGGFKWPFQGLSDLHLDYQKVTGKKLGPAILREYPFKKGTLLEDWVDSLAFKGLISLC